MSNRGFITSIVLSLLTVSFISLVHVEGAGHDGDGSINAIAVDGSTADGEHKQPKKKSNGFARVLGAPFKAIGKLFGGGKNDSRPRRMTEKDAKKFESAEVFRVNDALTPISLATEERGQTGALLLEGRTLLERGMVNEAISRLSRSASENPQAEVFHR